MTTHRLSHAGGQYAGLLRPRRLFTLAVALTLTFINLPPVHAQPTDITVRVLSRDAKFIGSSMGGAKITLRDAHTGQVLATGLTSGSTGNTGTVMHDKGGRRARLTDNDAAKFVTTLDLDAPTLLEVEAFAPARTTAISLAGVVQPMGHTRQAFVRRRWLGCRNAGLCGGHPESAGA